MGGKCPAVINFRQVSKLHLVLILGIVGILGCTEKKETVDDNFRKFKVEGQMSKFDLQFKFPKTFVSVRDIDVEKVTDTTNVRLNWILNTQYENEEVFCYYDSLDLSLNVFVRAGPRVDIRNKERKTTYFKVPTAPLNKIFPAESDKRKIIYDSGEKKHKDRIYYKRRYQIIPDSLGFQEYYYISTKLQSVLIIVNSLREESLDKYLLDYEVIPKPKDSN